MTDKQLEELKDAMVVYSAGILGTVERPSHTALFLDGYIQLQKETVAMCADETDWRRERSVLDGLLTLATAIRTYEHVYNEKHKQEATSG